MVSKSKMEAGTLSPNHPPCFLRQSLPAVAPMLLISTGYVDPGKWVATVEGGARFGFDLMAVMLIFNFAAIFCQYISARIGAITGKSLAQVFCLAPQGFINYTVVEFVRLQYLKSFCTLSCFLSPLRKKKLFYLSFK